MRGKAEVGEMLPAEGVESGPEESGPEESGPEERHGDEGMV